MIDAKTQEILLLAITQSSNWMPQITSGRKNSFDEIADEEHLAERHVRRLAQLSFLSPKIIEVVDIGSAPAGLTISRLTQSVPYAWALQQNMLGVS